MKSSNRSVPISAISSQLVSWLWFPFKPGVGQSGMLCQLPGILYFNSCLLGSFSCFCPLFGGVGGSKLMWVVISSQILPVIYCMISQKVWNVIILLQHCNQVLVNLLCKTDFCFFKFCLALWFCVCIISQQYMTFLVKWALNTKWQHKEPSSSGENVISVEPLMKDQPEKKKKCGSGGRLGFGEGFVYFWGL